MSEELKSCPFCGGKIYTTKVFNGELNPPTIMIQCNTPKCGLGLFGNPYITVDENKKLWNTRAEQPTSNFLKAQDVVNSLTVHFNWLVKNKDGRCYIFDIEPYWDKKLGWVASTEEWETVYINIDFGTKDIKKCKVKKELRSE